MRKYIVSVHKAASRYGNEAPCVSSHLVTHQKFMYGHSQYSNDHYCYHNEASP
ncbi:MAG: hypothetical protein IKH80_00705 [Bacteroidaceae bacterium]|nr:hypothetical protein [Bacteroidaceae bacterium]